MVTFMIMVVSGICVFSFLIAFCIMCTLALTKKRCSEDVIAELVGLNMHPSKKIYGYHPSEVLYIQYINTSIKESGYISSQITAI